jgi:hypothetical protein
VSAASGIVGAIITLIFLPDTTGLSLDELDRMVGWEGGGGRGKFRSCEAPACVQAANGALTTPSPLRSCLPLPLPPPRSTSTC